MFFFGGCLSKVFVFFPFSGQDEYVRIVTDSMVFYCFFGMCFSFRKSCTVMIKSLRKVKLCEMVHTETSPCEFEQPIRGLMSDSIEMLEIVFIAMCPFVTWCNFPGFLLLKAL